MLSMMREHAVKRLCVMDDSKRLSGIITQADVATHAPEAKTGELVEAIAAEPPSASNGPRPAHRAPPLRAR
jgi:CBS-domain-containing membrane protein